MKSQTFFLEDHRLIIEVALDPLTIDLMIQLRQKELDAGWVQAKTNLLISINTDIVKLTRDEYDSYIEWSSKRLSALFGAKVAIIVNNPLISALNMILMDKLSDKRDIRMFTTLRAAAKWLNVPKESIIEIANDTKVHDLE